MYVEKSAVYANFYHLANENIFT